LVFQNRHENQSAVVKEEGNSGATSRTLRGQKAREHLPIVRMTTRDECRRWCWQ